jgi:hypothetical protein
MRPSFVHGFQSRRSSRSTGGRAAKVRTFCPVVEHLEDCTLTDREKWAVQPR